MKGALVHEPVGNIQRVDAYVRGCSGAWYRARAHALAVATRAWSPRLLAPGDSPGNVMLAPGDSPEERDAMFAFHGNIGERVRRRNYW